MDQANALRKIIKGKEIHPNPTKITSKIITISSGKGGVGKSNFSINLAISLSMLGKRVVVIDADFGFANIEVLFDNKPEFNMIHILNGEKTIEEVIVRGPNGIKFISAGSGFNQLSKISNIQIQFFIEKFNYLDEISDIIIIDTGAGVSDFILKFITSSDQTIIITTPEPTAMTDAYALIKMVNTFKGDISKIGIVVNMVEDSSEALEVISKLNNVTKNFLGVTLNFIGSIPFDRQLSKAVKSQIPAIISYPETSFSKAIHQIAFKLIDIELEQQFEKQEEKLKGFSKFLKIFTDTFK